MKPLTDKELAFVLAYAEVHNAAEAYRRSYNTNGMRDITIWRKAAELKNKPNVAARILELRTDVERTAVLDRAGVINLITEIATADASKLSNVEIRNCRHCFGNGHRYQWAHPTEFTFRIAEVMEKNARAISEWEELRKTGSKVRRPKEIPIPTDEGGYGFNVRADPNPECPNCLGEGIETVKLKDTRNLKGAAKRLYAGVKKTREGIEIKTLDQGKAIEMLGRVHGIFKDGMPGASGSASPAPAEPTAISDDPMAASRAYQEMMTK